MSYIKKTKTRQAEDFITTFTGIKFHFNNPTPEEIDLRDIAHALSLTCRFGGHSNKFYSVSEHSIRVAALVEDGLKLSALLHDAHEAYLHDVPRPIKHVIRGYSEIANKIQGVIDTKFNIETDGIIKWADNILLATEARDLGIDTTDWAKLPKPLKQKIHPMSSSLAEADFLAKAYLWLRQ